MAATRKTSTPGADTVTVEVTEGTLVVINDEQRDGTITDVPTALADIWVRQGWATITTTK